MINLREIEINIVEGLQKELLCCVIRANQTAPAPPYPYVSYTVTSPVISNKGTYGLYDDGVERKPVKQIWSFTAQSDDSTESMTLALKVQNWFDRKGRVYLKDNFIVVRNVSEISNRDNLLTIEYEYRNGIDVTFSLMDEIVLNDEYIEKINIKKETIKNGK